MGSAQTNYVNPIMPSLIILQIKSNNIYNSFNIIELEEYNI